MGGNTSKTWQDVSGSKNWEGLLYPLDDDLRKCIIHYGERAQAIGDAFNGEDRSLARGFSRYPMDGFFSSVGLEANNPVKYEVTQFFYAREMTNVSLLLLYEVNWIGYVAVSTADATKHLGRRDILVVWRGTERPVEAALDVDDTLVSASGIFGNDHQKVMVHKGWHDIYTAKNDLLDNSDYTKISAGEQAVKEVKKQIENYKDEELSITVVGHSMGAALATLNAMDIVANGHNYPAGQPEKACQVTVFAFASPKLGDQKFKEFYDSLNREKKLHALRIFNAVDIVPNLPPVNFEHVGEQLIVDSRKSTYLKTVPEAGLNYFGIVHQLETILHVVAGWNGFNGEFDLKGIRDYSLVNKHTEALANTVTHKYNVPASWWVVWNKGMIQDTENTTGTWALHDYKPEPPQF